MHHKRFTFHILQKSQGSEGHSPGCLLRDFMYLPYLAKSQGFEDIFWMPLEGSYLPYFAKKSRF
jgi:hypothetical protein